MAPRSFPAIPEIGDVMDSSTVRGAITSVMGEGFVMHAHRHLHASGKGDQGWYKCAALSRLSPRASLTEAVRRDSYWGLRRMRHHRPRWCMVLYFVRTLRSPSAVCRLPRG